MCSAVLLYIHTNIDYDISMKGCGKMKLFQQLDQMVEKQDAIDVGYCQMGYIYCLNRRKYIFC